MKCAVRLVYDNVYRVMIDKFFNIPKCSDIQILVNPRAKYNLQNGTPLQFLSFSKSYAGSSLHSLPVTKIIKEAYKIVRANDDDYNSLKQFEVADEYLFLLVPCGHCSLCAEKKKRDIANRAYLESLCYTCPPMFFTLTYDPKHLPPFGELRYSDVQKFFKRLRRNWDKQGLEHNIRYLVAGEYGSKSGRPHYHVILFNNPYNCSEHEQYFYDKLRYDIFTAWNMCQPKAFHFEQCGDGAALYTAKYLGKSSKYDAKHLNKSFIHSSTSHGGIGSPYLSVIRDYYRSNPDLQRLDFLGKDGRPKWFSFGSYVSNHFYPSPARLVPPAIRDTYRQLCDVLGHLQAYGFMSFEDAYQYSELLRPFKSILINNFKKYDSYSFSSISDFCPNLKNTLFGIFYDLADLLSDCVDVSPDDFNLWLQRSKSVARRCNSDSAVKSLAGAYFRQNSLDAVTADKEIF